MDDIKIDERFDLLFADGDFVIEESTEQHQQLLLLSNKGDWRENPATGVGALAYLKDVKEDSGLMPEIKEQFEKDGMQVNNIQETDTGFNIDAFYK